MLADSINQGAGVAVQVWIGEKPEHPQERRAIVALARGLERLEGLYLVLANFSVGGRNVDLVVLKPDGIFIIELKYCDGKVFGDVNGPWFVEGANGERKRLNAGRKNPYNQVISYYYSLVNFLNDNRPRLLSSQKAASVDFRTCRRLVVIAPQLQEGSQVETDWKVDLKGLDELPAYLVTERSSEISMSEEEMLTIPDLLHCTRWDEIDALVSGALTSMDSPPTAVVATASAIAPIAAPITPEVAQPTNWFTRLQTRLPGKAVTWLTVAVASLAAVVAVSAVALILTLRPATPPLADQPAPMTASTSLPAGAAEGNPLVDSSSCVWSGFQPIGRKRGTAENSWETVGVASTATDLMPDVVVTLEDVDFCDGQIALTWSIRNNTTDATFSLPLNNENIVVRDSLGTLYPLNNVSPGATTLLVAPGDKGHGTVIVPQPVNQSAPTLLIQLRKEPFGEATWLVPISDS